MTVTRRDRGGGDLRGDLRGDLCGDSRGQRRQRGQLCGLFGGTFDPIHLGHLRPVAAAARAAGLAKVIYIPAGAPPHRPRPVASAGDRLAMVKMALDAELKDSAAADMEIKLEVDDIEIKRRGPSFTFDTVQELQRRAPQTRYALLLGLDALLGLETWHRWEALQRGVHIIGIARPGWRAPAPLPAWWRRAQVESAAELRAAAAGKIFIAETSTAAVSSTAVRARIQAGGDAGEWLPPAVRDYIRDQNLYAD
ncbi:MAG: nicotinate-nucleotide adenylyltransferase [Gammaproteobacteria bacterium]|nr:nicotinate-nucleotide adenylyltransferase [Gammaproteobacteria bacterium]